MQTCASASITRSESAGKRRGLSFLNKMLFWRNHNVRVLHEKTALIGFVDLKVTESRHKCLCIRTKALMCVLALVNAPLHNNRHMEITLINRNVANKRIIRILQESQNRLFQLGYIRFWDDISRLGQLISAPIFGVLL